MWLEDTIASGDRTGSRRSISEFIADQLRQEILSAVIEPGQSIKQDHIAQRFEVSQAPVREALRQLASEGLVTYQLNCGVRVPPLDPLEAVEIAALRLRLEAGLIKLASRNFGAADHKRANAAVRLMSEAEDVAALMLANEEFHEAIYSPAKQPVTLQLVRQLRRRYARYLGVMWQNSRHAKVSLVEHRQLLRLLRQGQTQAACGLLKKHVQASTEAIINTLR